MSLPYAVLLSAIIIAVAASLSQRWVVVGTEKVMWRVDQLTGGVEVCVLGNPLRCLKAL